MDNDINLNIDYTNDLIIKFHNNLNDKSGIDENLKKLIKNQEDLIKYINELNFLEKLYTINEIIKMIKNKKKINEIISEINIEIPYNYSEIFDVYISNILGKNELRNKINNVFKIKPINECINVEDIKILEFLKDTKLLNKDLITEHLFDELIIKADFRSIIQWIVKYINKVLISPMSIDLACSVGNINMIELYIKIYKITDLIYTERALDKIIENNDVLLLNLWLENKFEIKYTISSIKKAIENNNLQVLKILRDKNIIKTGVDYNIKDIIQTKNPFLLEEYKSKLLQSTISRKLQQFKFRNIQNENEYIKELKLLINDGKKYYNNINENTNEKNDVFSLFELIEYYIYNYEKWDLLSKNKKFKDLKDNIDLIIGDSDFKTQIGGKIEYILYIENLLKDPITNDNILDWLHYYNLVDGYYTEKIINYACYTNNIFTVKWLVDRKYQLKYSQNCLDYAVENNNEAILDYVYELIEKKYIKKLPVSSTISNKFKTLKMVKWFVKKRNDINFVFCDNSLDRLSLLKNEECFKILNYVFDEKNLPYKFIENAYSEKLIDNSIINSNMYVLKWVNECININKVKYSPFIFDKCTNENILKMFMENNENRNMVLYPNISEDMATYISSLGKINILDLWYNYKPKTYDYVFKYNETAVQEAIKTNNYKVVEWWIEKEKHKLKKNKEWIKNYLKNLTLEEKIYYYIPSIFYIVNRKHQIINKLLDL